MGRQGFSQPFIANQYSDINALVMTYTEEQPGCGNATSGPPSSDVYLVDLRSGDRMDVVSDWTARDGPIHVALSGDGSTMIVPGWQPIPEPIETLVVDAATNETILSLPVSAEDSTFALSNDASLAAVATGFPFTRIEVYNTLTGELVQTMLGEVEDVFGMAFTQTTDRLVSTAEDGVTSVWDVATGRLLGTLVGAEAGGTVIRLDDADNRLVVYTQGDTFRVYGLDTARLTESRTMVPCNGTADTFNLRGGIQATSGPTLLYAMCGSARVLTVHFWNRKTGEVVRHENFDGQSVAATSDGKSFVGLMPAVTQDKVIIGPYEIFDAATGQPRLVLKGVCEFDVMNGEPLDDECSIFPDRPIRPLSEALPVGFWARYIHFSEDGRFVGGADWDSTGFVWDASTGDPLLLTSGGSVALTPDGQRVAFFAELEGELNLFETEGFTQVASHTFEESEPAAQRLVFALDGEVLLGTSGGEGSSDVQLFDGHTLEPRAVLKDPHKGETLDIAVSGDGTMIATSGSDGRVRVWDVESLDLLYDLPVADVKVQSVDFVDDDSKIVAASFDGRVAEFILDADEYLAFVRTRLPRGFTRAECDIYFADTQCPSIGAE